MYYYQIDGYFSDLILMHEKQFSKTELNDMYLKALKSNNFNRSYVFEAMIKLFEFKKIKFTAVIDTDTDYIYNPIYED
jgi:hypothetical protein